MLQSWLLHLRRMCDAKWIGDGCLVSPGIRKEKRKYSIPLNGQWIVINTQFLTDFDNLTMPRKWAKYKAISQYESFRGGIIQLASWILRKHPPKTLWLTTASNILSTLNKEILWSPLPVLLVHDKCRRDAYLCRSTQPNFTSRAEMSQDDTKSPGRFPFHFSVYTVTIGLQKLKTWASCPLLLAIHSRDLWKHGTAYFLGFFWSTTLNRHENARSEKGTDTKCQLEKQTNK